MSCACKGRGAFSRHAEQPLELFWTSKASGCSCSVAQSDPRGPPTSGDGKTSPPLIFGQTLLGKFQKGKPRMRTVCLRQHTNLVCILYSTYFHNLLPPHFPPWPCTHAPLDKVTDQLSFHTEYFTKPLNVPTLKAHTEWELQFTRGLGEGSG